jgi:putative ABC transport system permease protein
VIVNERFAAQYWPGEDPLGKRIAFDEDGPWLMVVGVSAPILQVVPDSIQRGADPTVYVPYRQQPTLGLNIIVGSRISRETITNALREEVRNIDPDIPVFDVMTYQDLLARSNAGRRILGALFSLFALIALVLSAVGIYAVTAYSVSQRTQEVGVRMALGARGPDILWLVLRQGLRQLAAGLPLGLLGAFALSRLLANELFQITATDPATFISISFMLIVVVVLACMVPAHRASRVNTMDALRTE